MKNGMKKLAKFASMLAVALLASATVFASACGPEHTHSWSDEWFFDETSHWHECSGCDEKGDFAEHSMQNGECTVCGYEDGDTPPVTDTFPTEPDVPEFGADAGYTMATSGIQLGNTQHVKGDTVNVSDAKGLSDALQNAGAGDEIVIAGGTYEFSSTLILRNSGVYNGYIVVRAADDAEVILDFSRQLFDGTQRGVQIYGDYWYWYGVEITGAGDNGMFIAGNYNIIEYCEFHNNRDTGLQLGREESGMASITEWPSYNLIKNCTSYNNYDNETKGENADGFAAKLTVGYGNVFDGCIAYRNSDDGWDLYAYQSNGDIGAVIMYNCVAFENGYIGETVDEFNAKVNTEGHEAALEDGNVYKYTTQNGDGNGFKLGGSVMRGNVKMYNCLSFNNRMHGVTDNSNPGVLTIEGVTCYNNGADLDTNVGSDTFGEIVAPFTGGIGEGNNIDVARSSSSYNNLKDILSVADGYGGPGSDAYKGSVGNGIFYAGGTNYNQITDHIDAYSAEGDRKGEALAGGLDSAAVFKKLPFAAVAGEDGVSSVEYNISGLENGDIHETYRNADGSINMGDILAIADPDAVNGAGATLNLTKWEDYTHYYDMSLEDAASSEQAVLAAVYNTLYLYTDTDAVYQDFTLTTAMMGATISWSSSNDEILHIVKHYNQSNSGSQDVALEVYRPAEDTEVTLTAMLNYNGRVAIKRFDMTVKAAAPSLGDVYVEGLESAATETARRFLIDQYQIFEEPELVVLDGSDISGKQLASDLYDVEAKYEYATGATSVYSTVAAFSPSNAGVYRITYNVAFGGETSSYTYYIYVASNTAVIDFVAGTEQLIVNRDGYTLGGSLTNIKGSIFSYSTSDEAEIASLAAMANDSERVAAIGDKAASHSFTDNTVLAQFENDNGKEYTVYYWFTNGAGKLTSKVYSQAVAVETIATPEEFMSKLANNDSHTVYLLTADLDFTGVEFAKIKNLNGLINGDGHTIKNVTLSGSGNVGMFEYISGGTLMNVKLENIGITATGQRAGIFARSNGGYVSNVLMVNVNLNVAGRAGALIGHHNKGDLYIDNVALVNDDEHLIKSSANDIGGIVGFIQGDSGKTFGSVTLTDCFVDSVVDATGCNYVGGMVGRMEDRVVGDKFTLERCYSMATVKGQNYVGGILAAQNNSALGEYAVTVRNCIFLGRLEYAGSILTMPEKNSSGIFGRYTEAAVVIVENCFSNIEEAGYAEFVTQVNENSLVFADYWQNVIAKDFDLGGVWETVTDADGGAVAPYIRLTFGGMFEYPEF